MSLSIDLLSNYLSTRSFDWSQGNFCFARSPEYGERLGDLNFSKDNDFACLPSFHFSLFCPFPKLMYSEGKPPALISLWPSGNRSKENHCHFAWHSAADMPILLQCIQLFFHKLCLIFKDRFLFRFPPNFQERLLMFRASPEFVFLGSKEKIVLF